MLKIDGQMLKKMVVAGANALNAKRDEVDALNVFPVPDGDTGTNMSLTALAAAREVEKLDSNSVAEIAKAASSGSLRGARGNSGVIMSQLYRGFAKGLEGLQTAGVEEFAVALEKAVEMAYKAIMKPKEGTILTVARALAEKAAELAIFSDEVEGVFHETIQAGLDMLAKTQDMLPALKEAKVVDAGGRGLLYILQGAYACLCGSDELAFLEPDTSSSAGNIIDFSALAHGDGGDIEFGYCTEFFIQKDLDEKEDDWRMYLESMGDSIVLVSDDRLVKVHIHTNNPGQVLEKAMEIGPISNVKIDNMRIQHHEKISFVEQEQEPKEEPKELGFVAVSMGEGLNELFKNLGVDQIIEGGQTMNPSTEDILAAVNKINAKAVIVLPNNKNIIMAAQQAVELCTEKQLLVVPTRSISQGITAICHYAHFMSAEENAAEMEEAAKQVRSGQVTYAVRATVVNGSEIQEGDILCMLDGEITVVSPDITEGTLQLVDSMVTEETEIVTIFYGEDVTEEDAQALQQSVMEKHPELEVELQFGGQPIYYYMISAE